MKKNPKKFKELKFLFCPKYFSEGQFYFFKINLRVSFIHRAPKNIMFLVHIWIIGQSRVLYFSQYYQKEWNAQQICLPSEVRLRNTCHQAGHIENTSSTKHTRARRTSWIQAEGRKHFRPKRQKRQKNIRIQKKIKGFKKMLFSLSAHTINNMEKKSTKPFYSSNVHAVICHW